MKDKGEKQKGEEGESYVEERRKKEKREQYFPSRSSVKRQSKRVEARDKIGSRDESYAWVPETVGFIAFQKVEVSPILVISCLVAM